MLLSGAVVRNSGIELLLKVKGGIFFKVMYNRFCRYSQVKLFLLDSTLFICNKNNLLKGFKIVARLP